MSKEPVIHFFHSGLQKVIRAFVDSQYAVSIKSTVSIIKKDSDSMNEA